MVVDGVRPAVSAPPSAPGSSAPDRAVRPVIDARTIKTILYLGMKGDIALGGRPADAGPARASSAGRGVDTYA
jgi:hypothetical protein